MANPEHLAKLNERVEAWNQWRRENHDIKIDFKHASFERLKLSHINLFDANLTNVNFTNADLEFAYLKNANLTGANFTDGSLRCAQLVNANLTGADFTDCNLKFADLRNANLTGACIEDWNINSQTNLQNVKCDYIYLKNGNKDRVPHDPDTIFAPGEFTKRYQKILETVNLYFEDGIDWQAFLVSFNKLQVECDGDELSINSFENKGNGAFVIKVNVPKGADKAEIEKYLKKQYQLEATVEAQQKELQAKDKLIQAKNETIKAYCEKGTDLLEMARLMSNSQQNNIINMTTGDTYNQSGNFGIGHNKSNISDNSQVSGVNNETTQQDRNQ
ncbi:MAG: pentapeptide repeat-containing protein [Xenococcus sp. MO_188.B8]|nr:pentapeptide repeat-containing protein [Xenococcus sp. MO_188.B8]